jgi:hypothetical protein
VPLLLGCSCRRCLSLACQRRPWVEENRLRMVSPLRGPIPRSEEKSHQQKSTEKRLRRTVSSLVIYLVPSGFWQALQILRKRRGASVTQCLQSTGWLICLCSNPLASRLIVRALAGPKSVPASPDYRRCHKQPADYDLPTESEHRDWALKRAPIIVQAQQRRISVKSI